MTKKAKMLSLALVVGGLLTGLLVAEGLTRLFFPQNPTTVLYRPDENTVFRTLAHLNGHQTTDGKTILVKTNALGFRMEGEVATPKPKGEFRVLCVGDSYTFGWGVEWKDTFLAHFEKKARAAGLSVRFVNAGNPGWGTENMLAFLENYGKALEPDYIVLFMGPNDVEDNHGSSLYRLGEGDRLEKVGLKKSNPQFAFRFLSSMPGYVWLSDRSHLVTLFRKSIRNVLEKRRVYLSQPDSVPALQSPVMDTEVSVEPSDAFRETEVLFLRIGELARVWNVPLTITNIGPSIGATRKFLHEHEKWFSKNGLDYFFISPKLDERGNYWMSDRHFNERGNQVYADLAWPLLEVRLERALTSGPQIQSQSQPESAADDHRR